MKTKIEVFREEIRKLVEKFERDEHFYLSKQYLEAQARQDFIDRFFEALGWDIGNKAELSPFEREVLLEKGETKGRPDYNFRIGGASKFYVEAKAPSEPLDKTAHIMQAKSYAWNTKDVFIVVLMDFEEFKVFDATLKPDPRNPNLGLIYDFKYTDYLEKLDELWTLSREEVASGSLDKLLLKDAQSKRLRIPVDKSFLSDMTGWREELAKDLYKRNPDINVRMLNEVVQRILDRFVFIRTAEDRKIIEPKSLLELVELWKSEGKRRPLLYHLNILFRQINGDLNGEIFKPHACEIYEFDSSLLAKIIEGLYFPKCPYRFDVIGVELLGSIYERYLGNTIRLTAKRVKVEEKPEVRKAGGVYYTPKYIVDYIVANTVGKLIEGKTPEEIAEMKILDPACGSGSFLLGAYQKLIDYHIKYYTEHPAEAGRSTLFPDLIIEPDGSHRLSITKKAEILQNNIYGVDIDPQAVEVSMMSLYIKALEGERTLPQNKELLPSLANNVKCGNSLIGYDFFEQQTLIEDEERERINPFDWNSKKAGFGDIMEKGGFDCVIGNPPYVRSRNIPRNDKTYYMGHFFSASRLLDTYYLFLEKGIELLHDSGRLSFIIPNGILTNKDSEKIRRFIVENTCIEIIVDLKEGVFKNAAVDTSIIAVKIEKNQSVRRSHNFAIGTCLAARQQQVTTPSNILPQKYLTPQNNFTFNTAVDNQAIDLIQKISVVSTKLSNLVEVRNGMKVRKELCSTNHEDNRYHKFLLGRNVLPFYINWDNLWVCYDKKLERKYSSQAFREEGIFQIFPKLFVRQVMGKRIYCSLDQEGFYADQTIYLLLPKTNELYSPKYLLGILSSSLIAFYFLKTSSDTKQTFPKIKGYQIEQLPIRTIDFSNPSEKAKYDKLVALVDRMLELNSKKNALPPSSERERIEREIAVTDEKIDEIVYELYGLTEEEIRVVESK